MYGNFICQKAKMTFQNFVGIKQGYTHTQVRLHFSQLLQKLAPMILGLKITIHSAETIILIVIDSLWG